MTVLWGFAACLLFLRYRNLCPLAISHAILGICVGITVPGSLDHNMRVGIEYLTYQHQPINASEQKKIILLPTNGRTTKR